MLAIQQEKIQRLLAGRVGPTVLDVGGGHGHIAIPLSRAGHDVTVLGTVPECENLIRDDVAAGRIKFQIGDLCALPFDDDSFDTVTCLRLLTHCHDWERVVAEMCRVTRRSVVIDYPTSRSVNAIAPVLFWAKKRVEKDTRLWQNFSPKRMRTAFARQGFKLGARQPQYFFPMAMHRAAKCRALSVAVEFPFTLTGLTSLFGSPVLARFDMAQPAVTPVQSAVTAGALR